MNIYLVNIDIWNKKRTAVYMCKHRQFALMQQIISHRRKSIRTSVLYAHGGAGPIVAQLFSMTIRLLLD